MNIKQFKKRWLMSKIEPELFYMPVGKKEEEKPILYGSIYIYVGYHNVFNIDTKESYYDPNKGYSGVSYGDYEIVFFNKKKEVISKGTRLESVPYGKYYVKIISCRGGIVDNEFHEIVLQERWCSYYIYVAPRWIEQKVLIKNNNDYRLWRKDGSGKDTIKGFTAGNYVAETVITDCYTNEVLIKYPSENSLYTVASLKDNKDTYGGYSGDWIKSTKRFLDESFYIDLEWQEGHIHGEYLYYYPYHSQITYSASVEVYPATLDVNSDIIYYKDENRISNPSPLTGGAYAKYEETELSYYAGIVVNERIEGQTTMYNSYTEKTITTDINQSSYGSVAVYNLLNLSSRRTSDEYTKALVYYAYLSALFNNNITSDWWDSSNMPRIGMVLLKGSIVTSYKSYLSYLEDGYTESDFEKVPIYDAPYYVSDKIDLEQYCSYSTQTIYLRIEAENKSDIFYGDTTGDNRITFCYVDRKGCEDPYQLKAYRLNMGVMSYSDDYDQY